MTITLPYPISANRYWRNWRGRMVVSSEARAYKERVASLVRSRGMVPITGEVELKIDLYRPQKRGDVDNFLKVTIDALKGVAFVDDSQVQRIDIQRFDDKENPRVVVEVTECVYDK
jgi:crossover junction endodeoxyribonuclease RusA